MTVKRILSYVALGAGVMLIVLAGLVKWVAAPRLVKAPLTIPSKYLPIVAVGNNFTYFDSSKPGETTITLRTTRNIQGDLEAGDSKVAVYNDSLCLTRDDGTHPGCLKPPDPRVVATFVDRVAFDRKTGMAVNDPKYHESVDGNVNIKHEGLSYKFPIDTKKQTYPFFDTIVGKAFPAVYQSTEKIDGLTVYKFVQNIENQNVYTNHTFPSTYSNIRTVWIEPTTGVIIKGSEQLTQTLTGRASLDPNSDLSDPALAGIVALKGTVIFDDATVNLQAKLAKDSLTKIHLVRIWIPLVAGILGIVLVAIGLFALLRGRPESGERPIRRTRRGMPGGMAPPPPPTRVEDADTGVLPTHDESYSATGGSPGSGYGSSQT